jgi:hypothetical protein
MQSFMQRVVIANALRLDQSLQVPFVARLFLRTPWLRNIPARLIAFGLKRVHVKPSLRRAP